MLNILLVAATACCPGDCGPKWAGSSQQHSEYGDGAWQVCVVLKGGDPRFCSDCSKPPNEPRTLPKGKH